MIDNKAREKKIVRTSAVGITGNVFLVGLKAFVGIISGSVSIIMDAVNNLTDALSSIITIIGEKLSNKKPDKKHPYGHGRIEYIASTLIAMLILFAGGMAIYESIKSIIDHFQNGTMPSFEIYSLILISAAILVKVAIGIYFTKVGKKIDSRTLRASGLDALFDAALSLGTLIGALVAKYANFYVEGYLGILIGLFILKTGFDVLRESLSSLIGDRLDKDFVSKVQADILSVEGVRGCYDLILNGYGHERYIGSVHVGVRDDISAKEIQKIERSISFLLYKKYGVIMSVGIYAENVSDEHSKKAYDALISIIQKYPNVLQVHGFYLDEESKTINFDLVISFEDNNPEETIKAIKQEAESLMEGYSIFIVNDLDYSLS